MERIAVPTSTVRTPIFDKIGPTVDPHALKIVQSASGNHRALQYVHVVADLEFLHPSTLLLNELLHNEATDSVAGVRLVRVGLDYDATVDFRRVVLFVARRIVGVNGMAHIAAEKEGARNGLSQELRCRR